jgi:hypothetical protein
VTDGIVMLNKFGMVAVVELTEVTARSVLGVESDALGEKDPENEFWMTVI